MSNPHFAGLNASPLSAVAIWRSLRPVLILLAGVALAALSGLHRLIASGIVVAVVVLLLVVLWSGLLRTHLDEYPKRVPMVAEVEVVAWTTVAVGALVALLNLFVWLTERFPDKGTAYLVGLVAGALIGYVSKDLYAPIQHEDWFGLRFRTLMTALYTPYFYRKDPATGRWVGDSAKGRWMPDGPVADALDRTSYEYAPNMFAGWNFPGRRAGVRRCAP